MLTMPVESPKIEEWRRLYDAALKVKEMGPWKWMNEIHVFGVKNPEKEGETGYISVSGALGEHRAVSVYLGLPGLYGFLAMCQDSVLEQNPQFFFEVPQLHASFESSRELEEQDRDIIRKLGHKFRGEGAWPMFRSHRPACLPWFLEAAEARFLTHALEQVIDVAPRFKDDESVVIPRDPNTMLIRFSSPRGHDLKWEERFLPVPPLLEESISSTVSKQLIADALRLPRSKAVLELDFFMLTVKVAGKADRPYFPYVLLGVDEETGVIICHELLVPLPSLTAMHGQVPETLLRCLTGVKQAPSAVKVRSENLYEQLEPLAEKLKLKIQLCRSLPKLEIARQSFGEFAGKS
jgi:hypothetical protein